MPAGSMICMVVGYWLIALVPIVLMCLSKQRPESIGFTKEKKGLQVVIGIVSGLVIASLYFLVPYFMGFGAIVDSLFCGDRNCCAFHGLYDRCDSGRFMAGDSDPDGSFGNWSGIILRNCLDHR